MKKLPLLLLALALTLPAWGQGTQHGVFLTWNASTTSGVTYNVYRSTGSGPVKLNTTPIASLAYVDPASDLAVSTSYTYDVTAVDATGDESLASNSVVITTGTTLPSNPAAPTGCNGTLK